MSKHRKTPGHKAPGGKNQKHNGKKELKKSTVAAEISAAVVREEVPKPAPAPVSPPGPVTRPAPASVSRPAPPPVTRPAPPPLMRPAPAPLMRPAPAPVSPPVRPVVAKAAAKEKAPEPPLHLLNNAADTFERSFRAAGQGTVAVNRKLIDFARANLSSSFDFAISLASASSPAQIMQLQMSYWDERMKALASQAEELRALSADLMAKTSEPLREHMRRAVNQT